MGKPSLENKLNTYFGFERETTNSYLPARYEQKTEWIVISIKHVLLSLWLAAVLFISFKSKWYTEYVWWVDLHFIKDHEWYRSNAYLCSAWVWTIWYGTTKWENGIRVKKWDTITKKRADDIFLAQVQKHQNRRNHLTINASNDIATALTSFEYNLWKDIRTTNALQIIEKLNKWDVVWAKNQLKKYNKVCKKKYDHKKKKKIKKCDEIKWLTKRRKQEAKLLN